MIVPAAATPWAQSLTMNAAGGQGGVGSRGGDTHHYHINSNSADPREAAKQWNRNQSLRPTY
jgi:hypothetical protein